MATNFSTEAGQRSGNGKAEIRLISITEAPTPTAATEVGDNHWQYTIPNYNVEVQVDYHEYPGTGTENDPYIIASTEDWNNLADKVNAGKNYAGKFFRQTQDISVTTMIGVPYSLKFSGTYDGYGHTLTVTYNTTAEAAGPFRYIYGATIKNLHTAGTITTTGWYAGGFVGIAHGANTFFNCRSSVTINSNLDGDGSHGGFIGHLLSPSANTITSFEGCVFDGSFNSSNTSCWGGYIGWSDSDAGARLSLVNCLFAPQEVTINAATGPSGAQTFTRAPDPVGVFSTLTNTYYTEYLTNIQAKKAYFITGANGATVANAGTKTEYNVSGITSYGTGIKFGDTFYAGNGDEVSLALSHADAAEGYAFGGYEASSGTLSGSDNPYTLTMSSSDVTISATWKKILTNANITIESVAYDGDSHTAVVKCGETNLIKGTDYTVDGTDALTNVGSTTFTITGTGGYTGDVTDLTFTIYRNFAFTNSDWMTWYGAEDLTVTPSEMETYVVTDVSETAITIESTEGKIYLNTPMLLKWKNSSTAEVHGNAPATALSLPTGLEPSPAYIGGVSSFANYLTGTVYVLAGSEFVRARVTGETTFDKSKCFIYLTSSNANNSRLYIIGDGPTGINPVVTDGGNDTWYTIGGRKLSKQPKQPGVYISKGKKVIVK